MYLFTFVFELFMYTQTNNNIVQTALIMAVRRNHIVTAKILALDFLPKFFCRVSECMQDTDSLSSPIVLFRIWLTVLLSSRFLDYVPLSPITHYRDCFEIVSA